MVRNKTRGVETSLVVVKGHNKSPLLLCRSTLEELGILEIRPDGSLGDIYNLGIKQVIDGQTPIDRIVSDFAHIFKGVGKMCDPNTKKETQVTLPMRKAVPVAQKTIPIPYYLQKPPKEFIDQQVKDDIIEKCETDRPITWCSPLVV